MWRLCILTVWTGSWRKIRLILQFFVFVRNTPAVADKVARLGVKGLWNFSPMDLKLPYDVIIENVHLSDSLMVLGYRLNEMRKVKEISRKSI